MAIQEQVNSLYHMYEICDKEGIPICNIGISYKPGSFNPERNYAAGYEPGLNVTFWGCKDKHTYERMLMQPKLNGDKVNFSIVHASEGYYDRNGVHFSKVEGMPKNIKNNFKFINDLLVDFLNSRGKNEN